VLVDLERKTELEREIMELQREDSAMKREIEEKAAEEKLQQKSKAYEDEQAKPDTSAEKIAAIERKREAGVMQRTQNAFEMQVPPAPPLRVLM
jgi:hypothetical protein